MNLLYAVYALVAISSVQAWSPCRCNLIDNPVCGSDGVTYSNVCFLECAQKQINPSLSMVYEGDCKSQGTNACVCTIKYKPVCGSDGVIYDNMCEFRCAKKKNQSLHLERRDKIADDVKNYSDDCCVCPMEYNPVCGSDDVTYGNPCLLKCAQVKDANLHAIREGSCISTNLANSAFTQTRTNPFAVPTV